MSNEERDYYPDIQKDISTIIANKAKTSPFLVTGMTALLVIAAVGAYKFKNRGDTRPSIYLIHLRLAGQGAVIGCLTLGVCYDMIRDYFSKDKKLQ